MSLEALKDFDQEKKKLCFSYFLDVLTDSTLQAWLTTMKLERFSCCFRQINYLFDL